MFCGFEHSSIFKDYRKIIWDKKKVHLPSQLAELETKNTYLTRGYTGPTRNLPFGKTLTISAISAWLDNGPIGPFPWQGTVHWPRPPQPHEELAWRHRIRVIRLLSKVFWFFCDIEWISNGIEKMFNSGINCWILPSDGICINICINGQYAAAWRHSWLLCPPHWQENLAENLICSSLGVWITLISYYYCWITGSGAGFIIHPLEKLHPIQK